MQVSPEACASFSPVHGVFIYVGVAAIDTTAGGFELLKCKPPSSENVASGVALAEFLLSGVITVHCDHPVLGPAVLQ